MPLAGALAATGRLERALDTLTDALALVELADLRVRLIAACAACENLLGRHDAAHARLLAALDALDDRDGAAAAALYAELASDALYDGDFEGMREWAARAAETAHALADRGLEALTTALLCFAEHNLGHAEASAAAREESAALLDALPDDQLAMRLDAPYYLGFAEYFCERYEDAIRHLRRGINLSRAVGQGQFVVPMMVGLAHALETRGRLAEAAETADAAVEAARLAGNRQLIGWALVAEAWTAAALGDVERARAGGRRGDRAARRARRERPHPRHARAPRRDVARHRRGRPLPGPAARRRAAGLPADRARPAGVAVRDAVARRAGARRPRRRRDVRGPQRGDRAGPGAAAGGGVAAARARGDRARRRRRGRRGGARAVGRRARRVGRRAARGGALPHARPARRSPPRAGATTASASSRAPRPSCRRSAPPARATRRRASCAASASA